MKSNLEALARECLKKKTLKQTRQRIAVLSVLLDHNGPLTHQQIESMLTASMNRVTLYRVLDCLIEQGLAHKAAANDRVWRFAAVWRQSPARTGSSHSHFYCTDCGRFLCLTEPLDRAVDMLLPDGFEGHRVDMTIHGRCSDCVCPRMRT